MKATDPKAHALAVVGAVILFVVAVFFMTYVPKSEALPDNVTYCERSNGEIFIWKWAVCPAGTWPA
jgi:hypothetical protein